MIGVEVSCPKTSLMFGNGTERVASRLGDLEAVNRIVNVASVMHLSPFRYPGGKTWLVPFINSELRSLEIRPKVLVDPFLGGGSVPLAALHEGLVAKLVLSELDEDVASVWRCAFGRDADALCNRKANARACWVSLIIFPPFPAVVT